MNPERFYLACKKKQISLARQEISNAKDVNICVTNYEGRYGDEPVSYTALEWAIFCGVTKIVELLLKKNAKITPEAFRLAASNKQISIFKLLLGTKEVDKNPRLLDLALIYTIKKPFVSLLQEKKVFENCADNPSALSWAARIGDLSLVSSLLQKGADANKFSDAMGSTPLTQAVLGNNIFIVKLLLEKGANIHAIDPDGRTALMWAALKGNLEITKLLLENKADVNFSLTGETALMLAASRGNRNIIRLLLEYKADINAKDSFGQTAIFRATNNKDFKTVKLLLHLGADATVVDKYGRKLPGTENVLIEASRKGDLNKVKNLINKGTNINATDQEGVTALMRAAANNRKYIVELLLKNQAKPNLADKQGKTALIYAATNGYIDIVALLLENGADINQNGSTGTALNNAAKWGYIDIVKLLLEKGAIIHLKDNQGNTALDNALKNDRIEIVKMLQNCDNK